MTVNAFSFHPDKAFKIWSNGANDKCGEGYEPAIKFSKWEDDGRMSEGKRHRVVRYKLKLVEILLEVGRI
jgi:hypothetical protein